MLCKQYCLATTFSLLLSPLLFIYFMSSQSVGSKEFIVPFFLVKATESYLLLQSLCEGMRARGREKRCEREQDEQEGAQNIFIKVKAITQYKIACAKLKICFYTFFNCFSMTKKLYLYYHDYLYFIIKKQDNHEV